MTKRLGKKRSGVETERICFFVPKEGSPLSRVGYSHSPFTKEGIGEMTSKGRGSWWPDGRRGSKRWRGGGIHDNLLKRWGEKIEKGCSKKALIARSCTPKGFTFFRKRAKKEN